MSDMQVTHGPIRHAIGFSGRMPGDLCYTYLHRRADSGEPFYVGKGRNDRAWVRSRRPRHWQSVVEKHGVEVEIVSLFVSDCDAMRHERELIAAARASGAAIVNQTDGGEGAPGRRHSQEAKARIAAARRGKPAHPAAVDGLLRAARRPKSETHRARLAAANTGQRRSPEQIAAWLPALRAAMADPAVRAKISAAATGRKRGKK